MKAEDFFPLGWLDRQFRRPPYPDMTYGEAIDAAIVVNWNIGSSDARAVSAELAEVEVNMHLEHPAFPGRSRQSVTDLNELWRGKVTTLLTWFKKEGAK